MDTRRDKLQKLESVLRACRENSLTYTTPAIADRIFQMLRKFGLADRTEKEYVRILVNALSWEEKNPGKVFEFTA